MAADDFTRVAGQLERLVPKTLPDAMHAVVLQGVAIMKRETPRKTGRLSRSINGRVEAQGKRGIVDTNVAYATAVDEGSPRRDIVPRRAKALFWKGARHPVRKVTIPARKGRHFKQHTVERLRPIAEKELSQVFGQALGRIS
jgi:hypothetical protein